MIIQPKVTLWVKVLAAKVDNAESIPMFYIVEGIDPTPSYPLTSTSVQQKIFPCTEQENQKGRVWI